jgi:hypothetical protein
MNQSLLAQFAQNRLKLIEQALMRQGNKLTGCINDMVSFLEAGADYQSNAYREEVDWTHVTVGSFDTLVKTWVNVVARMNPAPENGEDNRDLFSDPYLMSFYLGSDPELKAQPWLVCRIDNAKSVTKPERFVNRDEALNRFAELIGVKLNS